ncbi:MAG: PilZ domain-containing protein [Wenzhouxiangella sp.]
MQSDSNRRRYHRFPFDAEASLNLPGHGLIDCELIDMSINGALLDLAAVVPELAGRKCVLDLSLRGLVRGDHVEIHSRVEAVWQEDQSVGCRFIGVDPESFSHLKTLTEDNLGDPSLLDRELTQLSYWPGVEIASRS